jgi:hypothetical protein
MNEPVEKRIHDELREALQAISDKYGIAVLSIDVEWTSMYFLAGGSGNGFRRDCRDLRLRTETSR